MMNNSGVPHTGESSNSELPPDNEMFPRPFRGGSLLFVSGLGDIGQGLAAPVDLRTYGDLKNFLAQVYGAFGKSLEQEWPRIVAAIQAEQGRSSMTRLVPGDTSGTIQKHIQVLRDSASHVTSVISDTEALPLPPMPGISGHVEINCGSFSQIVVIPPGIRTFGELRAYLLTITPHEIHANLVGDWQNLASSIRENLSGGRTIDPALRNTLAERARQPETVFVGSEIADAIEQVLKRDLFPYVLTESEELRRESARVNAELLLTLERLRSSDVVSLSEIDKISFNSLSRSPKLANNPNTAEILSLARTNELTRIEVGFVKCKPEKSELTQILFLQSANISLCYGCFIDDSAPQLCESPEQLSGISSWEAVQKTFDNWEKRITAWCLARLMTESARTIIAHDMNERRKMVCEVIARHQILPEPCPQELRYKPKRTCESVLLPTQIAPDDLSNLIEVANESFTQSILPNYGPAALPAAAQAVMALVDGRVKTAKDTLRGRPITSWPQLQELLSAYQVQDSDIANLDAAWQEVFRSMRSSTNALQMKIVQVAAKAFHLEGTPAEATSTSLSKPTAIVPAQLASQFGQNLENLLRQDAKAQQNTALLEANIRSFTFKAMKIFEGGDPALTDFAADVWKKRLVQLACELFSAQVTPESIKKYCSAVNAGIEKKIRNSYELKHQEPTVLGHPLSPNEITELWNAEDGIEGPEWRMKSVIDKSKGIYPHTKLRTKEEVLAVVQPYNPEKRDEFWYRLCVAAEAKRQSLPTTICFDQINDLFIEVASKSTTESAPAYGPAGKPDTFSQAFLSSLHPTGKEQVTDITPVLNYMAVEQFCLAHNVLEHADSPPDMLLAADTARQAAYYRQWVLAQIGSRYNLPTELPVVKLPEKAPRDRCIVQSEIEYVITQNWDATPAALAQVLKPDAAGNNVIYSDWAALYAYCQRLRLKLQGNPAGTRTFDRVWFKVEDYVRQKINLAETPANVPTAEQLRAEVAALPQQRIAIVDTNVISMLEKVCDTIQGTKIAAANKFRLADRLQFDSWNTILAHQQKFKISNLDKPGASEKQRAAINQQGEWRNLLTNSVLAEVAQLSDEPPQMPHYTEVLHQKPTQQYVRSITVWDACKDLMMSHRDYRGVKRRLESIRDAEICDDGFITKAKTAKILLEHIRSTLTKVGIRGPIVGETLQILESELSTYQFIDDHHPALGSSPAPRTAEAGQGTLKIHLPFIETEDFQEQLKQLAPELAQAISTLECSPEKPWKPVEIMSNTKALRSLYAALQNMPVTPVKTQIEREVRDLFNRFRDTAEKLESQNHVACWLMQGIHYMEHLTSLEGLAATDADTIRTWLMEQMRTRFLGLSAVVTTNDITDEGGTTQTEATTGDTSGANTVQRNSSETEEVVTPPESFADPLQEAFELCDATDDASKRQLLVACCAGIANQFGLPLIKEYTAAIQHWYSTADVASLTTLEHMQRQMIECRKVTTLSHDPNFAAIFDLRVTSIQDPLELLDIGMSWQAEATPSVIPADEPVPETTTHRDETIETPPIADEPRVDTHSEEAGDAEPRNTVAEVKDILDELDRADPGVPDPIPDSRPGKPRNNESASVAEIVLAPRLSLSLNQILVASRQTLHRLLRELRVAEEARDAAQDDPAELERLTKRHESVLIALQALLHTLRQ